MIHFFSRCVLTCLFFSWIAFHFIRFYFLWQSDALVLVFVLVFCVCQLISLILREYEGFRCSLQKTETSFLVPKVGSKIISLYNRCWATFFSVKLLHVMAGGSGRQKGCEGLWLISTHLDSKRQGSLEKQHSNEETSPCMTSPRPFFKWKVSEHITHSSWLGAQLHISSIFGPTWIGCQLSRTSRATSGGLSHCQLNKHSTPTKVCTILNHSNV